MTTDERDALLAALSPTEQRIYTGLERGKLSSSRLREATGRIDGMTTELRRLMELGLLRVAGKEERARGIRPAIYERVPLSEVEGEAAKFAARRPRRGRRSPGSKLAEMRRIKRGEFSLWHRTRKRILEETQLLTQLEPMAFWTAVPTDELEMVFAELLELRDWTDAVIQAIYERQVDDKTRATIGKILKMDGRTPAEQEAARGHATRLSRKLIPRDD
jgi:hypothetical protein